MDKMLRRVIPSSSKLTYNPLFKVFVDSFDIFPKIKYREMAKLPPNHMRIRIGVGNRLFANHVNYLMGAMNFWIHAFNDDLCKLDSTIVDIGCGCGRYAQYMRDYRFTSEKFTGKYYGIDIDEEMLDWCRKNYDAERFTFSQSLHESKSYKGAAQGASTYRLPIEDGIVDFVFSTSLFTHLLEEQLINYTEESFRVLRPGGHMAMSCFSMDHLPPTFGDRHTFQHQIGNAYVESLEIPEAAVAYKEDFLFEVAKNAGFSSSEVMWSPQSWQPMLIAKK